MTDNLSRLSELDEASLREQGLVYPGSSIGHRRTHKRFPNSSSSEEYSDIPLNIHANSPEAESAFETIPTELISRETLEYLGLSPEKADEIWWEWSNWPEEGPGREVDPDDGGLRIDFIEFITAHLETYEDAYRDDDDLWRQCLLMCGVNETLQNAIMDPTFKDIRLTNSCVFWIKDTFELRYRGLEDIRKTSHERQIKLIEAGNRRNQSRSGNGGGNRSGSSSGNGWGASKRGGDNEKYPIPNQDQENISDTTTTSWSSDISTQLRNQPGIRVLFKGIIKRRITRLFNETGEVGDISNLLSCVSSDFHELRKLFYFTPDPQVAEYYAAYVRRRCGGEVVILALSIRTEAFDALNELSQTKSPYQKTEWRTQQTNHG